MKTKQKRISSVVLVVLLAASFLPMEAMAGKGAQVVQGPSSWAIEAVGLANNHKLIPDGLKTKYKDPITRGELSTLVVRLYERIKGSEITERKKFSDTKLVEAEKVAAIGFITGAGDGSFKPDENITREQLAIILHRIMVKLDYKFKPVYPEYIYYENMDEVSSWALDSVKLMAENEILFSSDSMFTYTAKDRMTVEQSIAALIRLFQACDSILLGDYGQQQEEVRKIIMGYKDIYPTGTPWAHEKTHIWRGMQKIDNYGKVTYGWSGRESAACEAFATILNDAAFSDDALARDQGNLDDIKVGDIIVFSGVVRHATIVIDVTHDKIVLAEGNFDGKVRWGRTVSRDKEFLSERVASIWTRYPQVFDPIASFDWAE